MNSDATLSVRVPAPLKEALLLAANVKDVTLSSYCVEVLTAHAVDLGAVLPVKQSSTAAASGNASFMQRQVHEDLVRTYRRHLERSRSKELARRIVDAEVQVYAGKGVVVNAEGLSAMLAEVDAE